MIVLALLFALLGFLVSASVGMGGSLLLVPGLMLLFGPKEGIALAALLLGCNNVAKVVAYRHQVPVRKAVGVVVLVAVGATLGAGLLVATSALAVQVAVFASVALTLLAERLGLGRLRLGAAPALAFGAGACSGFSGTSGPLKGLALRSLGLSRAELVGAASLASLAGDMAKAAVFTRHGLLGGHALTVLVLAVPLMPLATAAGRRLNQEVGERAYAGMFWTVMAGYSVRLLTL